MSRASTSSSYPSSLGKVVRSNARGVRSSENARATRLGVSARCSFSGSRPRATRRSVTASSTAARSTDERGSTAMRRGGASVSRRRTAVTGLLRLTDTDFNVRLFTMDRPHLDAQLDRAASLGDPVRRALYRLVPASSEAVSRDDAAIGVGVARHVAKFHLDRLVKDGLLA